MSSLKILARKIVPAPLWGALRTLRRKLDFRYATARPGPRDYLTAYDHDDLRQARRSILWYDDWEQATAATLAILERLELLRDGLNVLDFGGGIGRISKALLERYRLRTVLVDASRQMLEHARDYLPEGCLRDGRARLVSADEFLEPASQDAQSFDLVLCVEVLQHVPELILDESVLPALGARTAAGGRIFVIGNRELDVDREGRTGATSVESVLRRHWSVRDASSWTDVVVAGRPLCFARERQAFVCAPASGPG